MNMDFPFNDIKGFKNWTKIEPIDYGWSIDTKYYVEDIYQDKYLLRISPVSLFDQKKKEFEIIKKFNQLFFIMSKAIGFGKCNDDHSVYMLLSWVEGTRLEDQIESMPLNQQYLLGVEAGMILKAIHSIPVEEEDLPKINKIEKKLKQLDAYEISSVRIPDDQPIIDFIRKNIHKICKLSPVYKHGDFHLGNMILTPNGQIGIIDFNRWECGDPYEEFYKMQSFGIEKSIPFCKGQIHGYFNGEPPLEFWETQAVYVAHASLYSIKWAEKFGKDEMDGMTKRCNDALEDYERFEEIIPEWYKK
jgi:aminoglycoside phosphotransferase (APT) family kinase protein